MPLKDCEFCSKVEPRFSCLESAFDIQRSLPHGHVAAVLGTLKNMGLESLISAQASRQRDVVTAMPGGTNYRPRLKRTPPHADYPQIPVTAHFVKS